MALNMAGLVSDLTSILGNTGNSPQVAAKKRTQAIAKFWSSGSGPGQSTPIGAPTVTSMEPDIAASHASLPQAALAAMKEARAIDTAFKTIKLAGGVYGTHISMVTIGPSQLQADLAALRSSYPASAALAAAKEAQKLKAYTTQGVASGSGIPPNVPPQIGSIK